MSTGFRHKAAVIAGLSLLGSLVFAGWTQLNSGTTAYLYSVHFPEGTQVGYAVGAGQDSIGGLVGVILKTTDRGDSWQMQDPGQVNALNSVYSTDDDNGYAVGQRGAALRTTDGGTTWNPIAVPITDDLAKVQFPEDGQIGYILAHPRGGPPSKALKTTDGGESWTAINVGGPASVTRGGGFANDTVGVIVGGDGLVLGTTDGLASTHYQGAQTNADLVAVAFSPDPNKAYLIGYDSIRGVIRYTADGGATLWDSVTCYSAMAFYGVDMPTSENACVCGSGGKVLRSVYATDFWMTMPTGVTADLHGVCFPHGADTGFVVGAGGTILRTYDGGGIIFSVGEGRSPTLKWTGVRVLSSPSRRGITFHADTDAEVVVFDAAGRAVKSMAATKGLNFLPLPKAGTYFVKAGAQTLRVVLIE